MSTVTRYTADELLRMPDDGYRYELVRGELIKMSPAGFLHGAIIARLTARVEQYVEQHNLGFVTGAETGYLIEQHPDTVRAPDIGFVSRERIEETGLPRAFYPGAPDLAVEVVSPNDTAAEVDDKAQAWLAGGTQLVWNVQPITRIVEIYRPARDIEVVTAEGVLTGEAVLPGFTCPVSEIFPQ
jgi:Uma2 family endonuclease